MRISSAVSARTALPGRPFVVAHDRGLRLVQLALTRQLSLPEAEDFIARVAVAVADAQTGDGTVRLLLDLRGNPGQPAAVVDRLWLAHAQICGVRERLAVVVASNVAKGALRRRFDGSGSKAFLSCETAISWLGAWS